MLLAILARDIQVVADEGIFLHAAAFRLNFQHRKDLGSRNKDLSTVANWLGGGEIYR